MNKRGAITGFGLAGLFLAAASSLQPMTRGTRSECQRGMHFGEAGVFFPVAEVAAESRSDATEGLGVNVDTACTVEMLVCSFLWPRWLQ